MYKPSQPAQYILYCDQSQYRIYCAGWLALYTTDRLHLNFKIRAGSPLYVLLLSGVNRGVIPHGADGAGPPAD